MLSAQVWFDVDMCHSSKGLVPPPADSQSPEKIKYVLCCHALEAYNKRRGVLSNNDLLELLWFTYGFLPCQFVIDEVMHRVLVSVRGICWIDKPAQIVINPDNHYYADIMKNVEGVLADIRFLISKEVPFA